jgi:hypothetical protein
LDALSTVDGQCCQGGLSNLDMEKGPSRRCHSSYQHPLGQPLKLTLVNDKDKRGAASYVDPYDGAVLFDSSTYPGYFDCYNKNAFAVRGARGYWAMVGWGGASHAQLFGKLMENKSRGLWELLCCRAQRSQHTVAMSITARGNV